MRIILLLVFIIASGRTFGQHWLKTETEGDKVEQTSPSESWFYADENASFLYVIRDNCFSLHLLKDKVKITRSYTEQGMPVAGTLGIIATFDKNQNRTNYWKDIIFIETDSDAGLICWQGKQLEENKNAIYEMWRWLKEESGSIVIRLKGVEKYNIDTEIMTIKTLGYEDKNGKHWDGDIDVIGM